MNLLKMELKYSIETLLNQGWSRRRIARELGIDRDTVGRYAAQLGKKEDSPSYGQGGSNAATEQEVTTGTEDRTGGSPPQEAEIEKALTRSLCEKHRSWIEEKLEQGLSARRIYQDAVSELGFADSYQSIKRFCKRLKKKQPERFWRMECEPGEEVQVDFGLGAPVRQSHGKYRRPGLFRMTLSFSRKGYSECVWKQNSETFLRCQENAFRYFGGVTKTICPDNLKAAVIQADWYDPQIHPKLQEFARHYGTVILPTRPYHPHHKGKIEAGVKYVQNNALKGRKFESLEEQNTFLREWESSIADQRIHGTTRQQVAKLFREKEKPALRALPSMIFPCFEEAPRQVHRDSYVEVARSYYEVPQEYIGRQVWVRWDHRLVRIFNQRMEQMMVHVRIAPGKFSSCLGAQGRRGSVEAALAYWMDRVSRMGSCVLAWSQALHEKQGVRAMRGIRGLLGFSKKHSNQAINQACEQALQRGFFRLAEVKNLIGKRSPQQNFSFLEQHPLIRDLSEYGQLIEPFELSNPKLYENIHSP